MSRFVIASTFIVWLGAVLVLSVDRDRGLSHGLFTATIGYSIPMFVLAAWVCWAAPRRGDVNVSERWYLGPLCAWITNAVVIGLCDLMAWHHHLNPPYPNSELEPYYLYVIAAWALSAIVGALGFGFEAYRRGAPKAKG